MDGHTPAPEPSEVAETTAGERCPGCGSVVSERFQTCRPVSVDVTQVGYRYLAGTWGYCLHLGRDIKTTETPLLDRVRREEGERIAQAIEDGCDLPATPCRMCRDAALLARAASAGRGEGL
ncbi:hypothetical protein [Nocardioides lacusdianchii]|uniref:hypothetical protein n=1 Tax=Nocardioides lacusdianchii TaxID=2783664 RepID=UPI001CCF501B|nr:hypothetical protein [Nocardioides lacusdianchii]